MRPGESLGDAGGKGDAKGRGAMSIEPSRESGEASRSLEDQRGGASAWSRAGPRLARGLPRFLLLLGVPLVAVALGLRWYAQGGRYVETENAYVKAHIVPVSAEVSGRVLEVRVRDNQMVAAGDVLFAMDPQPFELALARIEAQIESIRQEIDTQRAEHRVALAEAFEVEERIRFLDAQLERARRLREAGMIRLDAFDEARHNRDAALARLAAIRERAARVLAALGGRADLPFAQHPRMREAQALREEARLALARSRVTAPSAGTVSNLRLRPGENLHRGAPVFSLIQHDAPWVEANFKETQLAGLHVGQDALLTADAFPDRVWQARIVAIAPATGAQFAVLPPQNATGNWVKIVQRVPVLLEIKDAPEGLRAGMTVTVRVDTGKSRGMPAFASWWAALGGSQPWARSQP